MNVSAIVLALALGVSAWSLNFRATEPSPLLTYRRIKGYDLLMPGGGMEKTFFVLCVRGNPSYGKNDFHDNGDGTITDRATGLMWSKADSGQGMNWQDALAWVQKKNAEKFLGHDDWRLPSVKELQSIVDYTRSPDTTHSPAIDPIFNCTTITNEAHQSRLSVLLVGDDPRRIPWRRSGDVCGFRPRGGLDVAASHGWRAARAAWRFRTRPRPGRAAPWPGGPPGPDGPPGRRPRAVPADRITTLTFTALAPSAAIPRLVTLRCSRTAAARRAMSSASTTTSVSCASGRTEPPEGHSTVEIQSWFMSLCAAALARTTLFAASLDFDHPRS